jgi:glyoxylase-like metal-dependent hydrolase (beta-lactamase superfamily II)
MTQSPKQASDLGITLPLLPLNREFTPRYGEAEELAPGIRRVLAHNPNPFTFHGTGTYLIGRGKVAIVDPGPLLEEHVAALLAAVAGETVTHILITHTHGDHSPAAAPIKHATGAPTFGFGPHGAGRLLDGVAVEEGGDRDFVPDVVVGDGDVIAGDGWEVECVYTPGHTSNHLCFAYREQSALFCGDHVMGWSTTVIVPPDGDMAEYFASLEKLRQRNDAIYYPTHGAAIESPQAFSSPIAMRVNARSRPVSPQALKGSRKWSG